MNNQDWGSFPRRRHRCKWKKSSEGQHSHRPSGGADRVESNSTDEGDRRFALPTCVSTSCIDASYSYASKLRAAI
jgi:hypothetical protein